MANLKTTSKTAKVKLKKPARSKPKNKTTGRHYDNSKRRQKVNLNKQKIIRLYVDLLVKAGGEDVSLQTLAEKSKISLRTLFRFFGDKNSLHRAIEDYMSEYFESVSEAMERLTFAEYAEYSYKIFDRYDSLFTAYLLTHFGQKSRLIFRQKFYSMLLMKIQHELHLGELSSLSVEQQKKIKLITALINAQIWKDLKDNFELSGEDMAATVRWAVQQLLDAVQK